MDIVVSEILFCIFRVQKRRLSKKSLSTFFKKKTNESDELSPVALFRFPAYQCPIAPLRKAVLPKRTGGARNATQKMKRNSIALAVYIMTKKERRIVFCIIRIRVCEYRHRSFTTYAVISLPRIWLSYYHIRGYLITNYAVT